MSPAGWGLAAIALLLLAAAIFGVLFWLHLREIDDDETELRARLDRFVARPRTPPANDG